MIAVLIPPGAHAVGEVIPLDDEESRHLQVRRATDGIDCTGLDGEGSVVTGTARRGQRRWELSAQSVVRHGAHAETLLAVSAGDRDRFLWIVEKAAELHVTRVIPLISARQRNVENRLREVGIDRARRRAREACKQSGNPWFPVIDELTRLEELPPGDRWMLASAAGERCPSIGADEMARWIIGPEGGFTNDELEWIKGTLAATAITLGPAIMRFETAAIAAAVVTADRRMNAAV